MSDYQSILFILTSWILLTTFMINFTILIIERNLKKKNSKETKSKYIIRNINKIINNLSLLINQLIKNLSLLPIEIVKDISIVVAKTVENMANLPNHLIEVIIKLPYYIARNVKELYIALFELLKITYRVIFNNSKKIPDLIIESFSKMIYLVLIIGLFWTAYFMYEGFSNPVMLIEADSKASLIVSSATLFSIMVAYHEFVRKKK